MAKKKNIARLRLVTDSDYCYKAGTQELEYWKQRDFTNIKGEPLAHAHLWGLIAEITRSMYIEWTHVKSHTEIQDFDHDGNRQVDKMAQARPKTAKLSLILPPEWRGKDALTKVPVEKASQIRTKVHKGLGNEEHDKVNRFVETKSSSSS